MTNAKQERERERERERTKVVLKKNNEHDYLNKMECRINDLMLVFCKSSCTK